MANAWVSSSEVDPKVIDAYEAGGEWQRDYVYYNIDPQNSEGKFRNNYSEFITSIKINEPTGLDKISDAEEDPELIKESSFNWYWTEGHFEFQIDIFINAKNGIGDKITKMFPVDADDLFSLHQVKPCRGCVPRYESITPIWASINIELVPWNLENYSTGWKFSIYEVDASSETTHTVEHSSSFASNFEFSQEWDDIIKVGAKFGGQQTTTSKETYTVTTKQDSDYLGDTSLTFDQPIITDVDTRTGRTGNIITTYDIREISTGWVSITVMPKEPY